jgi:peptidoglycan/xylan/chitin deacetylase (PgdA/CDA1 family)
MPEREEGGAVWIARRVVKGAAAAALVSAGVHHAVRVWRRRKAGGTRVLLLSYHRVTRDFEASAGDGLPSMFVSAMTLQRLLEHVARTREIVSLAEARRILAEPASARRRDVVCVTFDDGYADNHEIALPILSALRIPATFFVATGYIGTVRRFPHDRLYATLTELARRGIPAERAGLPAPLQALLTACAEPGPAATLDRVIARLPHDRVVAIADALEERTGLAEADLADDGRAMTWEELRAIDAAGMDVAGHTVSHAVLANLTLAEARREIQGCRDMIAERLGQAPRHFAYPNGYYTSAVRRAVAEAGFEVGVTTEDRENVRGADPFAICRKVLWENSTLGALGYSRAVATCNLEGVFYALGVAQHVSGERPDAAPDEQEKPPPRELAAS